MSHGIYPNDTTTKPANITIIGTSLKPVYYDIRSIHNFRNLKQPLPTWLQDLHDNDNSDDDIDKLMNESDNSDDDIDKLMTSDLILQETNLDDIFDGLPIIPQNEI